jgi:hypothetical protein
LIRYIDHNPVAAGLTPRARDYPHASAWHYHRPRGPIWLARDEIEGFVRRVGSGAPFDAALYESVFGPAPDAGERWIVERGTRANGADALERIFDDLVAAAPPAVLAWMRERALVADRTRVGTALVPPVVIAAEIKKHVHERGELQVRTSASRAIPSSELLRAGLLRDVSGASFQEIARRLGTGRTAAAERVRHHRRLLIADRAYAEQAASVLHAALRNGLGGNRARVGRVLGENGGSTRG